MGKKEKERDIFLSFFCYFDAFFTIIDSLW